ncbi:MAG: bifunctional diaminohydroxyphosphoribosylaminopyrimidine deaminase/5-amino-6-(5-phosphoribosylamino)uracil reductase RibD [Planctomycetes bacterium]|nr:bifunctional diaminohydroxyphosphoribosylaminopyrimidine deaminase/5-amino-6-(5-phosphoribosylamino)uracil reductase RibD [Planctomycetota bacterium]
MREALELALRGRGEVEPNPRVGALAIREGRVVGRGWHRRWGGPHAEIEALADARYNGQGADTVVVTLEPCSTPPGVAGKKTPPCTAALIEAGVRRVVVGAQDPDPRHRAVGVAALEEAGIEVVDGVLADECRAINGPFERALGLDRPWTIAKYAMTLDGKTAAPTGESRWITGLDARREVHRLRASVDVVVVGFRTARTDDPELTVRHVDGPQPLRVVVDPWAELEERSKLVRTARDVPLLLFVSEDADPVRVDRLRELGVEIRAVRPAEGGRRLHLLDAWRGLRAERGARRVLVEGGGGLLAQLLAWDLVDQVIAYVAPKLVGGRFSPTPVGGAGKPFMAEAWGFDDVFVRMVGDDVAIGAFRRR